LLVCTCGADAGVFAVLVAMTDGMSLQIERRHPRRGNTQDDSEGIVVMTLKEPWLWVMVACVWTWASV
jgi:hypothetical protein